MLTSRTRTVVGAAGAAVVLVLTGCSGGGSGPTDEETPIGALDAYFQKMYGDFDEDTANAQQMEVEEITAECMREQGFEYTPVDYGSKSGGGPIGGDELDVEWGTREFAEQYGYGATTNPWGDVAEPLPDEPVEEFVDPNQEYVEAMSETEQAAYYVALYGEQTFAEGEGDEPVEYNWEDAGCQGKASHEVYEGGGAMDEEKFTALQEEMNSMYESIAQDTRISGLDAEWASCMADAGYSGLAVVGDAETLIYDRVNKVYEEAYADVDPNAELTEDDYKAIEDATQAQLAEITPDEIETATADFTCRDEVKYTQTQQEVNLEYQQEFVDTHKAELDAWLEAYQATQS